jgi:hypothetical protein
MNTKKSRILNLPLSRRGEGVSLSALSFLFSEMIQYSQKKVDGIDALEQRYRLFNKIIIFWISSRNKSFGIDFV